MSLHFFPYTTIGGTSAFDWLSVKLPPVHVDFTTSRTCSVDAMLRPSIVRNEYGETLHATPPNVVVPSPQWSSSPSP